MQQPLRTLATEPTSRYKIAAAPAPRCGPMRDRDGFYTLLRVTFLNACSITLAATWIL